MDSSSHEMPNNKLFSDEDVFLEPYLHPKEKAMFYKYMDKSRNYFEFGSGGSTHQAAKRGLKIITAEIEMCWITLLKKEIQQIEQKLGKKVDITYLLSDLQSESATSKENFEKYVSFYDHAKYQADFIYVNSYYQVSCIFNLYNQIGENTVIFVHELYLINDFYGEILNYFELIEKVEKSFVIKKKSKSPELSENKIKSIQQREFEKHDLKQRVHSTLRKDFNGIIKKYRNYHNENMTKPSVKQVWFFWWDGIKNALPMIKICLSALKKNFKDGVITVIDKDNFLNYVPIPSYIVELVEQKKITLTNFEDIYRMAVISRNGGLWIDATILTIKNIPEIVFDLPYFSIYFDDDFIEIKGKWCTFLQASHVNNIVGMFCTEMFYAYLEKYKEFPDYFFLDYLMLLGYEFLPTFKRNIQKLPINNKGVWNIWTYIQFKYSKEFYDSIVEDGVFFKISWKHDLMTLKNGELTVYGHIKDKYLDNE